MTSQTPTHDQVRDAWEAIAPDFDTVVTPDSIRHGEEVLRRLDIRPGTRFLDVAAGSGALSIPAARRGARVTAIDVAPAMIERLTARARAQRLTSVEGRVMNFEALRFADDSFDVAASQNGVTMAPDAATGLAEMVRVTRPGGTVLVAAFGPLQKAEFIRYVIGAVAAAVPGFPGLPADPPPFQLADPDVFRGKLTAAGLTGVSVDTITWDTPIDSATHLWNAATSSNPIGAQLAANLTAEQRSGALQVLDGILRERSGGQPGAVLHAEINVGTGTA